MRNFAFILVFTFITSSIALAQLADGSTAPNFTITDIDGASHTLYDILDEGKPVLLDLFATWCDPCWDFAATGVFDQFDELYGPNGDNSVFTLAVESDPTTAVNTLYNSSNGNWTSVIHYTLANDDDIADAYALAYHPTIYLICPNRTLKEIGLGPSISIPYWNVQTLAQEVFINTCLTSGVGIEEVLENNISIFPNPAFGSTSISLNLVESNDVLVELVNALGQKVFVEEYALTSGLNTIEIPLNDLSDGMYFINLQISDQLITEKLHVSE